MAKQSFVKTSGDKIASVNFFVFYSICRGGLRDQTAKSFIYLFNPVLYLEMGPISESDLWALLID